MKKTSKRPPPPRHRPFKLKPKPETTAPATATATKPRHLLRTHDVCDRLGGITKKTLWDWVTKGIYPKPDVIINGQNYYCADKHEQFLAEHEAESEVA
jgi:hypothetical protein